MNARIFAIALICCVCGAFLGVLRIELGSGFFSSLAGAMAPPESTGGHPLSNSSSRFQGTSADIYENHPRDSIVSTICDGEKACRSADRREIVHGLRRECSAFRAAIHSNVQSPVSSMTDKVVSNDVSGELVCFHRGELYSDESSPSRRHVHVRRGAPVIAIDMKDLTSSLTLSKATKVTLSRSLALTMVDIQAGYHLFHLLADNVLPLVWHLYGDPSPHVTFLEKLRRSVVFTTQASQRHQIGKCTACVELVEVFSPRVHYAHVDDDNIQCFCGGYFSGVVYLPYFEDMYQNRERSRATRWLQTALARHFGLPAYSGKSISALSALPQSVNATLVRLAAVADSAAGFPSSVIASPADEEQTNPPSKAGFTMNGAPRLLLVQRKKRSIGPIMSIFAAAQEIGYDVAFTFFEGLPMMKQFGLSRFTDVFLSIHGMALTWAFAMDGSTLASRGCRTLIELRHYVRPFPLKLQFYKHIASSANLSYVEIPASGCKFGKSVRNPEKEKGRMFHASFVIGLKGFHDQVAFYNVSLIKQALAAAYARAKTCPR
jgi:hypothetical protein